MGGISTAARSFHGARLIHRDVGGARASWEGSLGQFLALGLPCTFYTFSLRARTPPLHLPSFPLPCPSSDQRLPGQNPVAAGSGVSAPVNNTSLIAWLEFINTVEVP